MVPQSVAWDRFSVHFPSLVRRSRKEIRSRVAMGREALVAEWRRILDAGVVENRAQLAKRMGVSRARITQALGSMTQPA